MKFFNFLSLIFDSVFRFRSHDSVSGLGFHVLVLPLNTRPHSLWILARASEEIKLLINHKMMPTDKHIDNTTVLQSNMNSNLTKFIFGCLKNFHELSSSLKKIV